MALFRRNNQAVTPEPATPTVDASPTGKKDRPTPTRKEAEAARRQRMATTLSKKEARLRPAGRIGQSVRKAITPEAAPEKVLMRDYIDSRFNLGNSLPAVVVILMVTILGNYWPMVTVIATMAMYLFIIGVFVDGYPGAPLQEGVAARLPKSSPGPSALRNDAQHADSAVPEAEPRSSAARRISAL